MATPSRTAGLKATDISTFFQSGQESEAIKSFKPDLFSKFGKSNRYRVTHCNPGTIDYDPDARILYAIDDATGYVLAIHPHDAGYGPPVTAAAVVFSTCFGSSPNHNILCVPEAYRTVQRHLLIFGDDGARFMSKHGRLGSPIWLGNQLTASAIFCGPNLLYTLEGKYDGEDTHDSTIYSIGFQYLVPGDASPYVRVVVPGRLFKGRASTLASNRQGDMIFEMTCEELRCITYPNSSSAVVLWNGIVNGVPIASHYGFSNPIIFDSSTGNVFVNAMNAVILVTPLGVPHVLLAKSSCVCNERLCLHPLYSIPPWQSEANIVMADDSSIALECSSTRELCHELMSCLKGDENLKSWPLDLFAVVEAYARPPPVSRALLVSDCHSKIIRIDIGCFRTCSV